jgi:hypothetical protein
MLDRRDRCPGNQCSEAIGTALFTGSFAALLFVASLKVRLLGFGSKAARGVPLLIAS